MFIVRYGSDLRIENGGGACMYIRAYATSVAASSRSSSPPSGKKEVQRDGRELRFIEEVKNPFVAGQMDSSHVRPCVGHVCRHIKRRYPWD